MFHSSELMPGASPYRPTQASVDALLRLLDELFGLARRRGHSFVTLSAAGRELAALRAPAGAARCEAAVKVLLLKEALPSGGAERQLALITEYLPERWERRVWTMGGGPFVEVIRQRGQRVDVSARAARLDVRPAADLWRLLREWRPDVVHSWDWMSSLAALPVCALLGIPIVDGTIRNGIARRRRSLPLRAAMAASKLIVANSQAGLRAWGVGAAKGRVVYNAFDPARWPLCETAPGDSRAGAGADVPLRPTTVVMTARMVAHKDFATVIAAARDLDARAAWALALRAARRRARAAAPAGPGRRPRAARRGRVRRPRPRGAAVRARGRRRGAHVERGAAPGGLLQRDHGVHGLRAAGGVQRRRRQPGAGAPTGRRASWCRRATARRWPGACATSPPIARSPGAWATPAGRGWRGSFTVDAPRRGPRASLLEALS